MHAVMIRQPAGFEMTSTSEATRVTPLGVITDCKVWSPSQLMPVSAEVPWSSDIEIIGSDDPALVHKHWRFHWLAKDAGKQNLRGRNESGSGVEVL